VIDEFTYEGLAIDVDTTTSAERVIGVLAQFGARVWHVGLSTW
jgi:hypothetical protein